MFIEKTFVFADNTYVRFSCDGKTMLLQLNHMSATWPPEVRERDRYHKALEEFLHEVAEGLKLVVWSHWREGGGHIV